MSLLRVTAPLVSLVFFSAFSVAQVQVSAPNCTLDTWDWTFNSLSQTPCTVLANMMATCNGGNFTVPSLSPRSRYSGPIDNESGDLCYCSTVGYSLFSACGGCQGQEWITWLEWVANCAKTLPPMSFPNPVPSGIRVPQWALLDVTKEDCWNAKKSSIVGGSILGPSGVSDTPTSSSSASFTGSPTPSPRKGGSPNTIAIAGVVIGSIAAISTVVTSVFFYRRRPSQETPAIHATAATSQPQLPLSDERTFAPSPLSRPPIKMRLYDPNNPATFPEYGYHGNPFSMDLPSQVTISSTIGTGNIAGNTQANTQTSLPQARKYNGRPTL
ncbi:hypothetical protein BJV77DRAFT_1150603 [Russula vinacea]|nr:hypothetical protein BJV77DRAFT_1150603 [Russula vinacea]